MLPAPPGRCSIPLLGGAVGYGAGRPGVADAIFGGCVAVGLLAAVVAEIDPGVAGARPVDAGAVALAATVAAAVAARRRYPVSALVVLNAVCLLWFACAYPGRLIALAPLIGCYTLAAERGWRWGLAGALPTALIEIVAIRVVLGDTETAGVVPIAVLLAATAGSAGAAVGYYRALLAATRAELARETQSREERARRLAVEERLRIARELHYVFGHAMATISVQPGVGLHVLEQRPGQAHEALAAIKKICDDGLTDVKTILGILRADSGTSEAEPRTPRGGLDRLTDLLATAKAGGLRVELHVEGDPRPLPAPVDLAAYRTGVGSGSIVRTAAGASLLLPRRWSAANKANAPMAQKKAPNQPPTAVAEPTVLITATNMTIAMCGWMRQRGRGRGRPPPVHRCAGVVPVYRQQRPLPDGEGPPSRTCAAASQQAGSARSSAT